MHDYDFYQWIICLLLKKIASTIPAYKNYVGTIFKRDVCQESCQLFKAVNNEYLSEILWKAKVMYYFWRVQVSRVKTKA